MFNIHHDDRHHLSVKIICTCSYCTDIVNFLFGNKPRAGLEMFYRHDETFQNSAATGLLPNKMLTTAIVPSIITDIINFYCTFSQLDNKRKIIGEGKKDNI